MAASLNPYISQFGETFDAEKSSQYRMAIQFALGGLSYALLDSQTRKLVALEFYQSDLLTSSDDLYHALERALESKGLNGKAFQSVMCLFDNRFHTIVPAPVFDEANLAKYLDFSFQIPEGYAANSEVLAKAGGVNVYAFPKALQIKVLNKWKNAEFSHSSTQFINNVMERSQATEVHVNVHNRDFDMAILQNGQLHFFNNFKFNTKEDFAYFLLFAMEQNGASGLNTPVYFSGLIRPASDIIDLCSRYVNDIRFVDDKQRQVCKAIDEVPFQYYFIHYQVLR